ncbi:MAG: superoxide dismutase [Clostridium sp.]|nr:superoxide dismutase [Prevotella sp.]MCM1429320.1 superoxide dismutase [Clostridium sp.]MCM1475646.1 superoxide dismutase [Muribaculaceae bacterium]
MKFELPPLPYAPDALAPTISAETISYHYGRHEKTYIDTLNKLKEDTEYDDMPLEKIVVESNGKIFNNAAQTWNHIFYFFQFAPETKPEPEGDLRRQIDEQFGSFAEFQKKFEEAGTTLFGSGWVWLSADENGRLYISQGPNASNPMKEGMRPILTFDVWEHAYYIDYRNRRADYLHNLWKIVNWDVVELRYTNS